MSSKAVEKLTLEVAAMGRRELVAMLRELQCSFELDFTDEYLQSVSLERLQHLVLVAALHSTEAGRPLPTHTT